MDDTASAEQNAAAVRPRRRLDRGLLVASLVIAVGVALVARGLAVSLTGDDRASYPEAIERLDPVPEAVQVLSQTQLFVDLATGYTGVLIIDDVEIETVNVDAIADDSQAPGAQLAIPPVTIYEPGNATLTFTPSAAAIFSEFTSGQHRAQVVYWKLSEGRGNSRSYSWTFTVV